MSAWLERRGAHFRQQWRDTPFAQKLAILLIALVSIPLVAVVIYTTEASRAALIAAARERNHERANGTVKALSSFLADARADIRTASFLASIVDLCERPTAFSRERAFRSLEAVREQQGFRALYVTDSTGRVLQSTDARAPLGSYQTGRAFLSAIAGETAIQDPAFDAFDDTVVLRISNAVRSRDGTIIGTTTALVDVRALDGLIQNDVNYAGNGEFGVLWDGDGTRLSDPANPTLRFASWQARSPDDTLVSRQRLGPAAPVAAPTDEALATVAERSAWLLYDGTGDPHLRIDSTQFGPLQASMVPLSDQRWLYGIFVPEPQLLATLRQQSVRDWAVAFFTVLSSLVLSIVAARWVAQPLSRVTETANALAEGDMTRRVALEQRDEFGQLSSAFDQMAEALAEKERQLAAYAQELERRVAERTSRLDLLERASRTLASSLELQRTCDSLAGLMVPEVADYCQIDVNDGHGKLRRMAYRHAQTARQEAAARLAEVRVLRAHVNQPRTRGVLAAQDAEALGLGAVRTYALTAGRQLVGFLTVGMTRGARDFDDRGEALFEDLGRRAGLAIANALLYHDAQDANRLKDEFLGVVSHELRTPLNAIMGWTRLAALPDESGIDSGQALQAVERNAQSLARLVDDLLDVPRIITGKLALDLRPVDLMAVVNAAVDAIRPAATAKHLSLRLHAEAPSVTIEADPHRLQQVFSNLLSNAVKFTPAGGRIDVRARRDADQYVVVIEDSGIGISADFLPYVFDRFRQADSSTTRAHGGLGIGLSIVRHLVEMHGGRISASSDGEGKGSAFAVHLPVSLSEPAAAPLDDAPTEDATNQVRGMRLLILDDDPDSLEVTTMLLASCGAVVTTATSVGQALELLRQAIGDYDAILADIGMPGEDGYAFIAGLRASTDPRVRMLPVVAVTAYATRADRARALASGFDEHVAKPLVLSRLLAALALATSPRQPR